MMGLGVLTGLALLPAAKAGVTALTAAPSTQSFYVDGKQIQFEAYAIHGNNYVKLRDVGKAVDFGVAYDAKTNSVYLDPEAPYQEVAPQPALGTAAEESVKAALDAVKARYPHGSTYPAPYHSASNGPYGASVSNCAGWAILCSDAVFGDLPWRRVDAPRWEDIRVGDMIEYDNDMGGHAIIVIGKTGDTLTYSDSGPSSKVYWGSQVPRWWMEQQPGLILYTRYPA